jgi:hypothetical protein
VRKLVEKDRQFRASVRQFDVVDDGLTQWPDPVKTWVYLEKMDNRAVKGADSKEWKNAQLIGKR